MKEETEEKGGELQKKLEECEKKATEYLVGWQRARADLLNYKKEEMERIGELVNYTTEELILKILPILDNFEIAEKNLAGDLKNDETVKGILQIKNQILDFLKSQGVEEIKSAGERFDPNFHEVVEEAEPFDAAQSKEKGNGSTGSPQEKSGIIIEEIQKGYKINKFDSTASAAKINKFDSAASATKINGRLLRPAKVKTIK